MWQHPATRRNVATLRADGITVMEPDEGPMACGEYGPGRLPEPEAIWRRVDAMLTAPRPLAGRHVLVTAGPTWEPIDPVRYIANRSSGKQGFAIAAAAAEAGAQVTLVAGPVHLPTPAGVTRVDVESAREMAAAVDAALPADIAVMVAAVADWRPQSAAGVKIKKAAAGVPTLSLAENPDILAGLAASPRRPALLVGFAAETNDVIAHAREKLARKRVDMIVANDVSGDVMGGDANAVHIVRADGVTSLPEMAKGDVARALVERFADALVR
jgi:phosphopantothenoylcysteine decarboxylase/phosphopantothenate--cysteine ligase